MKNLFKLLLNFFKKIILLFLQPSVFIGVLYLLWFFNNPMEISGRDNIFENFRDGLYFYLIYILTEISVKTSPKNWLAKALKFMVIAYSVALTIRLISWIAFINMYLVSAFLLVIIVTTLLLSAVLINSAIKNEGKAKWRYLGLIAISLTPILLINISYYLTFNPYWVDSKIYNGWEYYIVPSRTWDDYEGFTNIYKCEEKGIKCSLLRTNWSSFPPDEIVVDAPNNEVHFIESYHIPRLRYTDAKTFRIYDMNAKAEMDGNIFFISVDDECSKQSTCETVTYQIYSCKEDFTSCYSLPMTYISNYKVGDTVDLDIKNNSVFFYVYDDDYNKSLVYIYSDDPRCFKTGCSILNQ